MKESLRLLFAPCSEISRQTSMRLDHELPRAHRAAIRFHYLYCKACRRYRRQIQFMREALRQLVAGALPADALTDFALSPEARERIKRFVRD